MRRERDFAGHDHLGRLALKMTCGQYAYLREAYSDIRYPAGERPFSVDRWRLVYHWSVPEVASRTSYRGCFRKNRSLYLIWKTFSSKEEFELFAATRRIDPVETAEGDWL